MTLKDKINTLLTRLIYFLAVLIALYLIIPVLFKSTPAPQNLSHLPAVESISPIFDVLDQGKIKDGELHVIHFFASWCGMCKIEHPYLYVFKEHPNIILHGIVVNDYPQSIISFIDEHGNPYDTLSLSTKEFQETFMVRGLPETFVINKDLEVLYHKRGLLTPSRIEKNILSLTN